MKKEIYAQPQRLRLEPAPGWDEELIRETSQLMRSWSLPSKFTPTLAKGEHIWLENLDFRNLIEVPLRLLTAADALWPLQSRHVGSFGELVHLVQNLPWDLYLPAGATLRLKTLSFRSKLFHEGKIEELCAGELQKLGFRIGEGPDSFRLICEQIENRHTIYLSLAGDPLFHRRYKTQHQHGAPLQEHLAAAALSWARSLQAPEWKPELLCIPFAGSGTFYMEQLLQEAYLPSYRWRLPAYSVASLACLPAASWQQIIKRLDARPRSPLPRSLLVEKDEETFAGLTANIAGFLRALSPQSDEPQPELVCADVFQQSLPPLKVWMPLNPPYGLRLEQGAMDAPTFYAKLARWLTQQKATELRGFVLIPDPASLAAFEQIVPRAAVQGIHSFSQGGQHIRCLAFRFGAGAG